MAAAERGVGNLGRSLKAIDYKTGKVKWSRPLAMGAGGSVGGVGIGPAEHGREAAVRQQRRRRLRRLRSVNRQAAVARRSRRQHQQRSGNVLLDGRQYVVVGPATCCTRSLFLVEE